MKVLNKQYSIAKPFIEHLKELFPDKLPMNREININQVAFLQGQQSVIDKIEEMYDQEFED